MVNFNKTYKKIDKLTKEYEKTTKKPLLGLYSKRLFEFEEKNENIFGKIEEQCEQNLNTSHNKNPISNELLENIFKKINFLFFKKIEENLKNKNIKKTKIKFNELLEVFYSKKAEFGEKNIKLEEYLGEVSQLIKEFLEINKVDKGNSIVKIIVPGELFNIFEEIKKNLIFSNTQPRHLDRCLDFETSNLPYMNRVIENNFLNKSQTFNFEELSDTGGKLKEYKLNLEKVVVLVVVDAQLKINDSIECSQLKNTKNDTYITEHNQYKTGAKVQIDRNFYEKPSYKFFVIKSE